VIQRKPVYIELDRRRQLTFNLNTEIMIRDVSGRGSSLWETVGESKDAETGEVRRTLDVNLDNLRTYLWAALYEDAEKRGEKLTIEDVGRMLSRRKWVTAAVYAISEAMNQYYGDTEGEAEAPAE